ncbi:MAG: response regulator [Pseudomonadota bacterium]
MTLERKTIFLFLTLGLAFCVGTYGVLRLSVLPAFAAFEEESSNHAMDRVLDALASSLGAMEVFNAEYAYWDQTGQYVDGERPQFAEEYLTPEYWRSIYVDAFVLLDRDGAVRYQHMRKPDGEMLDAGGEFARLIEAGHPLIKRGMSEEVISGFVRTTSGLMQVVACPVLSSDQSGPVRGTLITGSYIDDVAMRMLGEKATASVAFLPEGADGIPATLAHTATGDRVLQDGGTVVRNYTNLHDIAGAPVAVIEVTTRSRISQMGMRSVNASTMALGLACAVFLVAAWLLIRRLIVQPVEELTETMRAMGRTGRLPEVPNASRADEIGLLAGEFTALATQLDHARAVSDKARDEAISLSRAKSDFLARMSHEILTPMNGVLGMTELLQGTPLGPRQKRFTHAIHESAESLLGIINDILDFSKIEADKLRLDIIDVDLQKLLEETVESLSSLAHRKQLEFISSVPSDLATTVRTDPGRLRQVLTNLLSNAIKFTDQGDILLSTQVRETDSGQLAVYFEVADTGIGIGWDKQEQIFDSFVQEDGSTTRNYGGTGLGLAIARQIVEQMGGELKLDSVPGAGATFSFEILMDTGAAIDDLPPTQAGEVAGRKILVVDDNATNREILENQLARWQADAHSVRSAALAFDALTEAAASDALYDLVILDMHMPVMDGLGLAQLIRDNPAFDGVKLLMLSSVATPAPPEQLESLNIAGQLDKPVRQSRLREALCVALGGGSVARHGEPSRAAPVRSLTGRVLLAEDNPVNQVVALGMLENLGLEAEVAPDGAVAVGKAASGTFDAILMDCQMPRMDGFEATRAIRQAEARDGLPVLPVIALTANALKGDRERCLAAGMTDYLTKPFTAEQLHDVLSTALGAGEAPSGDKPGRPEDQATHGKAESVLDAGVMQALAQMQRPDRPSIVQKVVSVYLEDADRLASGVTDAIKAGDAVGLRDCAHALKSSSNNVGACRLARVCSDLETLARCDDVHGAAALGERFNEEYEAALAELHALARPAEAVSPTAAASNS